MHNTTSSWPRRGSVDSSTRTRNNGTIDTDGSTLAGTLAAWLTSMTISPFAGLFGETRRCCGQPDLGDELAARPRAAIIAPTNQHEEELDVLSTVRIWLRLRELGDANGAAELSTDDVVVQTPLGVIHGIRRVREQVWRHNHAMQALGLAPAAHVRRSTAQDWIHRAFRELFANRCTVRHRHPWHAPRRSPPSHARAARAPHKQLEREQPDTHPHACTYMNARHVKPHTRTWTRTRHVVCGGRGRVGARRRGLP